MTDAEKDKRWEDFLKTRDEFFARNPHLRIDDAVVDESINQDWSIEEKKIVFNELISEMRAFREKIRKSPTYKSYNGDKQ
jgi:hypothetical protein